MLTPRGVHAAHIGHGITAILVVRTGEWVWLSDVSVRIWQASLTGTLDELEEQLVAQGYQRDQVRQVLHSTLHELSTHGLGGRPKASGRPRRLRRQREATA